MEPCIERVSLNHWTIKEVLSCELFTGKRWKFPVGTLLNFTPQWTCQSSLPSHQNQLRITVLEQPKKGQVHQPHTHVCTFSMAHLAWGQQGSPSVTDSVLTPKSKLPTGFLLLLLQKKFADPCSRATITNGLS